MRFLLRLLAENEAGANKKERRVCSSGGQVLEEYVAREDAGWEGCDEVVIDESRKQQLMMVPRADGPEPREI